MLPVFHWYHCWADGAWREPAGEHAAALHQSGFRADGITIGLVGNTGNISVARDWFREELAGMGPLGFIIAETGFEQMTLQALRSWAAARDSEAACLYAHTKGALSPGPSSAAWRKVMTDAVVTDWRECAVLLGDYDAAGAAPKPHQPSHGMFFAGNFWWARASYLARLPEPGTGGNRWEAEVWIGLGNPRTCNLRPGWSPG